MTKNALILGAGTAGALAANTLVRTPDLSPWEVTVVDRAREHVYLPGLLFLPFRLYGYDRPRAIARERGDGLVVVPLAGLFEDSARHVARAGYPRLREFRGLARGAFVMLGDYACALLMTRAQSSPSPRGGPIDPDQAPGARASYLTHWGSGFCSAVVGCAHESRREPSSFVPTMRWGGLPRPPERARPDCWRARGRPALPLR